MKIWRILECEGPIEWIEKMLNHPKAIHKELKCGEGKFIREISVFDKDTYVEVSIEKKEKP